MEKIVRRGRKRTARMTHQEAAERFWARVRRGGVDDCWEWQGPRDRKGYGCCYPGRFAGSRLTHRFAWSTTHGPIPQGLFVCHKCDNPPCCNPNHLFLGTVRDNAIDMVRKGRGVSYRGIKSGMGKLTPEQVQAILSDERGQTILARELGVTSATIGDVRLGKRAGIGASRIRHRHANAKLSVADVKRIRADLTRSSSELARELGVCFQTVWRIRKGRGWEGV